MTIAITNITNNTDNIADISFLVLSFSIGNFLIKYFIGILKIKAKIKPIINGFIILINVPIKLIIVPKFIKHKINIAI